MKALGLQTIPLAAIQIGERLRPVDEAQARLVADSVAQIGLRQPIEVRKKGRGWILIAGRHRLRAAELLGWTEIPAMCFQANDDEARLAEIDENLVRHELNPLDRAVFLAERKAIYERLHPETRAGVAGGMARQGSANDIMSFAADTAERCGISARTVERAVSIATRLAPEVRARLAGTEIARKQNELLALSKLPPEEQAAVLDLVLSEPPQAKTVGTAVKLLGGARSVESTPADAGFQRLLAAWRRAGRTAQRAFLEHLRESGDIDDLLGVAPELDEAA